MATQNALNNQTGTFAINTLTGILSANATSPITASAVAQYTTLVAGASNLIVGVAPSATSGIPLVSGGSAANPSYSTALVPGGGTGVVSTTAYGVLTGGTTTTGAFQNAGAGTTGQVLVSAGASALPVWTSIETLTWVDQTSTPVTLAINTAYAMDKSTLITATLPATAAFGSVIKIVGKGAGGWLIAQPAGVTIHWLGTNSTTGTGGSIASTNQYDCVELNCTIANTDWTASNAMGNITIV